MSLYSDNTQHEMEIDNQRTLPLLPLRGILVFPNTTIPLEVGREKSVAALEKAMSTDRLIALVAQRQAKVIDPKEEDLYTVGTMAEIKQLVKTPDGSLRIVVEGRERISLLRFFEEELYNFVEVKVEPSDETKDATMSAAMRSIYTDFEEYAKASKRVPQEISDTVFSIENPSKFADDIAENLHLKIEDKQEVLECFDVSERLELVSALINREMEILRLERKIHLRVRKQMEKSQKEYYLREQIKAIQKELGEKDEKQIEVEEFKAKIEKIDLPEVVLKKALNEVERLDKMPPMAAESVVVRTYLDWITSIPWKNVSEEQEDINLAQTILDEDHWGLEKVKKRIIEFLSVRQLSENMKSPILCFTGPPGVGKTSLAKSIARALGRKFVRFSLGGVRDEAEIRGHRRTYIGAMPGKIIQSMRQAGTMNPVILLDEIDKMASDFRGDPSSALLEVLDPEQNCNFGDHYLEVEYDLSKVLFITTANVVHSIPRPLQDRMEIINIPGYTEDEKLNIANGFLIPKQYKQNGLESTEVNIPEDTVLEVIRRYTRESGVRNLERQISSICRKLACEVVKGSGGPFDVDTSDLAKYLGAAQFRYGVIDDVDKVGVVTGLAWTETGGEILDVEVSSMEGTGKLILTGQLGEVMKESAQAGYTYVRSRAQHLGISKDFYQKKDIHIHIPEGAIPKDGPSAGISMATALASALSGRFVLRDVAMTGEITLRGRVLPIGGLKEKALAAHRAGIKTVIIPYENHKDLEDIPEKVLNEINFVEASHMDEVLAVALSSKIIEDMEFVAEDMEVNPISLVEDEKMISQMSNV